MHHILRFFLLCTILISTMFASQASACLWDYDTLKAEAAGLPGVAEIITGRFDRFPPLYYEMRLEQSAKLLESDPNDLDSYDNAGVSCDRLGHLDEAIEWMFKKTAALDRLQAAGTDVTEHQYRYLANLGTFHIHRWLKSGADREDMVDVQRSRELIAAAIELNPDAHFGRERYQLLAIDWILEGIGDELRPSILNMINQPDIDFPIELSAFPSNVLTKNDFDDAPHALSGLISLGAAWQSIDIYFSLYIALLNQGDGVLAQLCQLRIDELILDKKQSLSPTFYAPAYSIVPDRYALRIKVYYEEARTEADDWVAQRNTYAMERLEQNQHPDTHPDFWNAWYETTSPPKYPAMSFLAHNPAIEVLLILGAFAGSGLLVSIGAILFVRKRFGPKPA